MVAYDENYQIQWSSKTPIFSSFLKNLQNSSVELLNDGRLEVKYQGTNFFIINKPEACFPPLKNYDGFSLDELKVEIEGLTKEENELKFYYDKKIEKLQSEVERKKNEVETVKNNTKEANEKYRVVTSHLNEAEIKQKNLEKLFENFKNEKLKIEKIANETKRKLAKILRKITLKVKNEKIEDSIEETTVQEFQETQTTSNSLNIFENEFTEEPSSEKFDEKSSEENFWN